jgi:glycosyltransferase involved in cell wall biosynthesis
MGNYKLSIIIPCYQRPQRTLRILDCILSQSFYPYHCMFISDGCDSFHSQLSNGMFNRSYDNRNKIEFIELDKHYGGWGYKARETGIDSSDSEYTIFVDNDDFILPNHFENYYNAIANTDFDFVYLNSFVEPNNCIRHAELSYGSIGHSELIIKTSFLKKIPKPKDSYGHDFDLVMDMINAGAKHSKSFNNPTYIVKSIPNKIEPNID